MRIAIASDHAGFQYKQRIISKLRELGHKVNDHGTYSEEKCDYPDFIKLAAFAVANKEADRGIVLGGSGNGEAIVANKIKGIRCALCWDIRSARFSRLHNDANMISLGQRMISIEAALEIIDTWLNTEFEGGRHINRINKISELEE